MSSDKIVRTTVVGSYPQPGWLIDHELLKSKVVPRVRTYDVWRVAEPFLEEAQNDATLIAIRDQERAGVDCITDGEIRRESYSNRFATSLEGIDTTDPFIRKIDGFEIPMPRIVGPLRRLKPVETADLTFLKRNTDHLTKITLPGPFTLSKQAADDYYCDPEAAAMAYAEAVNAEAKDLAAGGADVIQLDEPWLRQDPDGANEYGIKVINRALEGVDATTAIHLCFGYGFIVSADKPKAYAFLSQLADCRVNQVSIEAAQPGLDLGVLADLSEKSVVLGVVDLSSNDIETADVLAERIRRALPFVAPERLIAAPDCGMKYLSRAAAFGKLCAMVEAADIVRREIG